MKGKLVWPVFWALVAVFVVVVSIFLIPALRDLLRGLPIIIVSGSVLLLLGVALIVLTVREKVTGLLKKFLLLTGASAAGIFVSVFLHNAIYGLFIYWFGADFWDRIGLGDDEPFFFIMAIFVGPIAFLVGVVGSVVLAIKHKRIEQSS